MSAETLPDTGSPAQEGTGQRVAKNAIVYLLSQLITWGITICVIAIQPRLIGETGIGQLRIANTVVITVVTFACLSIEQFLVVEIGRNRKETERLACAAMGLRVALLPLLAVMIMMGLVMMKASPIVWQIGFIHIIRVSIGFVGLPLRAVLGGWENARMVALIDFVPVLSPLVAFPLVWLGGSILIFPLIDLLAVTFLYMWLFRYMNRHMNIRPIFNVFKWRKLVLGGSAFLANEMMAQLYDFVTVFLLTRLTSEATVGVYSQAIKFQGSFLFVPVALGTAMLPSLARIADLDKAEFRKMEERTLVVMIATSLPVATMVFLLAHPLCRIIFGPKLLQGVPDVLQISALNMLPLYISTVFYRFLVAERKNLVWSLFLFGTVVLNGVLCWFFIPYTREHGWHNGAVGAVGASLVAECATMLFAFMLLRLNPFNKETLGRVIRAVLATAVMGLVIWKTRELFLLIPVILGSVTFIGLAWALKVLGAEEQEKLVFMIRKRLKLGQGAS